MYLWVFQGNLGDGKTFGASVLAHYFQSKAQAAGVQVDLYSNYGLKGSKPLDNYKDFYNVARSPNSIGIMDEAHVNLDSRLFSKGSNIFMTQFFFYFRKLHHTMFLTTPSIRNLDSRVRNLTNILVDCRKAGGSFIYNVYDYSGEKLLKRLYLPAVKVKQLFACKLYNTDNIVRNVQFPSTEREFDKFLTEIINARNEFLSGVVKGRKKLSQDETDERYVKMLTEGVDAEDE
jgi:hypothetical protein